VNDGGQSSQAPRIGLQDDADFRPSPLADEFGTIPSEITIETLLHVIARNTGARQRDRAQAAKLRLVVEGAQAAWGSA